MVSFSKRILQHGESKSVNITSESVQPVREVAAIYVGIGIRNLWHWEKLGPTGLAEYLPSQVLATDNNWTGAWNVFRFFFFFYIFGIQWDGKSPEKWNIKVMFSHIVYLIYHIVSVNTTYKFEFTATCFDLHESSFRRAYEPWLFTICFCAFGIPDCLQFSYAYNVIIIYYFCVF